jgi:hypothetical protein
MSHLADGDLGGVHLEDEDVGAEQEMAPGSLKEPSTVAM